MLCRPCHTATFAWAARRRPANRPGAEGEFGLREHRDKTGSRDRRSVAEREPSRRCQSDRLGEIQAGRWLDSSQLDPGVYYVLLQAFPDFDTCYQSGGGYDPSCADGYSDPVTVNVPVPKQTYRGTVERQTFLKRVELGFVVNPLGAKLPYRVCYLNALKTRRCPSWTGSTGIAAAPTA